MKDEEKTLFMLIGDVHRQFGHKIRDLETKSNLGPSANCILFELEHHGDLTQIELVNKVHMRPSSISVSLQKMESEGLIIKKVKDDDQRYFVVSLTEKGKKTCNEMKEQVRLLDEKITKQIDEEDVLIVKRVLREISEAFKGGKNENI